MSFSNEAMISSGDGEGGRGWKTTFQRPGPSLSMPAARTGAFVLRARRAGKGEREESRPKKGMVEPARPTFWSATTMRRPPFLTKAAGA